jgi:hypothetical protein
MKVINWTVIDWSQRTVDIAASLSVSPSVVSYHRLKNHLRKNDRANHRIDWSNVDWTQPNFLIASFKNATPGAVSAARKEHAPEELRSGYNVKGSHSKLHVRGNYKKKEVKVTTVDANVAVAVASNIMLPQAVPISKTVQPSWINRKLIEIREWLFNVCVSGKKVASK